MKQSQDSVNKLVKLHFTDCTWVSGAGAEFCFLLLQACTARMNLSEEVDLEDYVGRPDKISNAEISAICQEAGMHAVRKNRYAFLPLECTILCLCNAQF